MSTEYHNAGNTEANEKQGLAALFAEASPGIAKTGVLTGLGVSQTATASGSVQVGQGSGVVQGSLTAGASVLSDPAPTLDVLTANPVGALPRNDIVVFDGVTAAVKVLVGTANATPTDPTVPNTALKLARLRHAANAPSILASKIDDLRVFTSLRPPTAPAFTSTGFSFAPGVSAVGAGFMWRVLPTTSEVEFYGGLAVSAAFTAGGVKIGTLPVGVRPARYTYLAAPCAYSTASGGTARVEFDTDGSIMIYTGSSTQWVRFDKLRIDLT